MSGQYLNHQTFRSLGDYCNNCIIKRSVHQLINYCKHLRTMSSREFAGRVVDNIVSLSFDRRDVGTPPAAATRAHLRCCSVF